MKEGYDSLPGCIGLRLPEPPNDCDTCIHKRLCLRQRQKYKEWVAPIVREIESSLSRLEAAAT